MIARLLALAILFVTSTTQAEETAGVFDQANKFYEQGKYAEAVAAYEKVLPSGKVSPALLFNLGNACFKAGYKGRALAAYHAAARLAPRDPDLRANLQYVRKQVDDGVQPPLGFLRRWLANLTLNEWTLLTTVAAWSWCLLLTLREWRPALRPLLRGYVGTLGVAVLVLSMGLAGAARESFLRHPAVVVVAETVVRYGPIEESKSAFVLHDGSEVEVLDAKDDWLQVADVSNRVGWLKRPEVTLLGGLPKPAR